MRVTDLSPIQSSIQPEKVEKWMSNLNYYKEGTQDKQIVAISIFLVASYNRIDYKVTLYTYYVTDLYHGLRGPDNVSTA